VFLVHHHSMFLSLFQVCAIRSYRLEGRTLLYDCFDVGLESQMTGKSSNVSDVTSQQSAYSSYPGQVTAYGVTQPAKQAYHPHHGYPGNPYSQVNSSGTSFTSASSIASVSAYPPSNTLNQYQHVTHTQPLNTYQVWFSVVNTNLFIVQSVFSQIRP